MLDGDERVIAEDLHAEVDAGVGDLRADVAQADDADALALELVADERLLGLLGVDQDVLVIRVRADPVHRLHDAAAREDEHREDELLDGVGVGTRRVEHDDAALGVLLDGDVVHAGAAAGDGADGFRQVIAVEVGRAHEDSVCAIGIGDEVIALAELDVAILGDVVDRLNMTHYACSFSNSVM